MLHALSQFTLLLLLSRFGGKEVAGHYVLALAVTAPIFLFFDLNLRVARATDHQHGESYSTYIALRFWTLLFAICCALSVGFTFYPDQMPIIALMTAYRVGDSISNLSYGNMQRAQQTDIVGSALTGRGLIYLAAILIVIPLTSGNEVILAGVMAAIALLWAFLKDLPRAWQLEEGSPGFGWHALSDGLKNPAGCWRVAKRTIPLGFDAGISSLALNTPRYCIKAWWGADVLGVFGLLTQLAFAIQKFVGAMGHTGVSLLSKHFNENKPKAFWRLFNRLLLGSSALGALSILLGTILIPILLGSFLGPSYDNRLLVFILLLASALTGIQRIAGRATQASGQYLNYTLFDVVIFVVSAVCSFLLIEPYGAEGGAAAIAIAFLVGSAVTLIHTYFFLWPTKSKASAEVPESI